jgi:NADH-quinone oxidoreductase subunit E
MSSQVQGAQKFDTAKRAKTVFSESVMEEVQIIIERYPEGKQKSALLPILHIAQAEFDGWVSPETMDYVASILKIQAIEVYEVASFYSMYNLKPVGKCQLEVCHTSACWTRGAEDVVKYLEDKLGVKKGEITPDGMFSIKTVECLGDCGGAPMLQCGASYHSNLTFEKIDSLLADYRASGKRRNYTDLDYKNTI